MNATVEAADADLRRAVRGRCLVTVDRFTSTGRTCVRGATAVTAARPALSVGYYGSWAAAGGRNVLAVEERVGTRVSGGEHRWLDHLTDEVVARCQRLPHPPMFAARYASPALNRIAAAVDGQVLAVPAATRGALEDRTALNRLLVEAGVPAALCVRAVSERIAPPYVELARKISPFLVVQPAHTSGGRGTTFVRDRTTYDRAVQDNPGPWRISQLVEGFSSSVTVLTLPTRDGGCEVFVDQPSHKPVGVMELGIPPAKGAGNDWSQPWPRHRTQQLIDAIVRLGTYLYDTYGLVGLWGVDAIFSYDRAFITRINVGHQDTTELSGVNQVLRGLPPLLIAHLTILAGGRVSWLPTADDFNTVTLRRTAFGGRAPFCIKLRNPCAKPVVARSGWRGPGVYRLDTGGALVWLRPGATAFDADLDRREVLLANAPAAGVVCGPGAELGTVEGLTTTPVFDGPLSLSPLGYELHHAAMSWFTATDAVAPIPVASARREAC